MTYQITLSDQEYAALAAAAAKSGTNPERLLHDMIQHLQPSSQRKPPLTAVRWPRGNFTQEPGHEWIETFHDPAQGHRLSIAQAALVEVVASICRKAREQNMPLVKADGFATVANTW